MARNGNGSGHAYRRYRTYRRRRRNGNGHAMPVWALAAALFLGIIVLTAGILAGIGYGVYQSYADDLIPPEEAIAQLPRGGARILDREGRFLYEYVGEGSGLRDPVPAEEISLWVVLATIATEDTSFMENPGVNFRGLAAAAWENLSPFGDTPGLLEGRGGSSITQQLVKNVYFTPEERTERSIERKIKETVYALELTDQYDKQQIMTWYLNQISYGNVFVGIEAAAQGYFGKHASELTLWEAATLAGIPASPSLYDPIEQPESALARRNVVLKRMYEEGYIDGGQLWEAVSQPLDARLRDFGVEAPHFVFNQVQPELERLFGEDAVQQQGLVVYTSLDLTMQERAEEILEQHITTYEYSGGHNGSVVAIDPKTGEVLVYVGSRDYFREDIQGRNDMADALNSPGSAFKPFGYLTAFMDLGWGPSTEILDTQIDRKYWDGERLPVNPTGRMHGPIAIRQALGNSLNVSAVKIPLHVGIPRVVEQAQRMGITTLEGRQLGPALMVGGVDVKLIDMAFGYSVFPNQGILRGVESELGAGQRPLDPVVILRVEDRDGNILYPLVDGQPAERVQPLEERVAPAAETFLISDILSDKNAHCITYGVCGFLSLPDGRPFAVKTGTSQPYEQGNAIGDTWTMGYSEELVVGTWFGNADNSPMFDISSTNVSWLTVRDFAAFFHEGRPVQQFTRPDDVVRGRACAPSGRRAEGGCPRQGPEDWFAAGSPMDDWWTIARIDVRTGKLASEFTPPQYVREGRFLRVPDTLTEFQREQAIEWSRVIGATVGTAPTEQTQQSDIPVAITSPAPAEHVSGVVTITGRAASAEFTGFRVEVRAEGTDDEWAVLHESTTPVDDGALALWDTSGLPEGLYTIQLVLNDSRLGEVLTRIQVIVTAGAPPPGEPPEPEAEGGGAGPLDILRR